MRSMSLGTITSTLPPLPSAEIWWAKVIEKSLNRGNIRPEINQKPWEKQHVCGSAEVICEDRRRKAGTRPWLGVAATEGGCSLFFLRKERLLLPCDLTNSFSACGLLTKGGANTCSTSGSNRRCFGVPLLLMAWVGYINIYPEIPHIPHTLLISVKKKSQCN